MAISTKRKSKKSEAGSENVSKKPKYDISWFLNGLLGNDPFTVLKRFLDEASGASVGEGPSPAADVVFEFLQGGGTGKEILALLEVDSKRKASEVGLICSALEVVFVRIATDLTEYRNTAIQVGNTILESHMKTVYMTLAPSSNAIQVKAVLRLLTSMVTLGHVLARELVAKFDFTHACVTYILQRRSLTETPDVRSTYLMFITAFFMEEDAVVLRAMAENRAILQPIFPTLVYDTVDTLQIFLTALRERVASSTLLSKTLKLRIFNSQTLIHFATLYHWRGPSQAQPSNDKKKKKKKEKPAEEKDDEETQNNRLVVADLVHPLLTLLGSSHKYGLAFADHTLGLSGKIKNSVLFNLLQGLEKFWERTDVSERDTITELVVFVMQSCPDLLRWYLPTLAPDLSEIRTSKSWLSLASLICRVIDVQNVSIIVSIKEKYSVKQQTLRAAALMAPQLLYKPFVSNALQDSDLRVRAAAGRLLLTVLRKAAEFREVLLTSSKAAAYSQQEREAILSGFKDSLRRILPAVKFLVSSCRGLMAAEERKEALEHWAELLELMTIYAEWNFYTRDEEADLPAAQLLNEVMQLVQTAEGEEEEDHRQQLESLQLAAFKLVASLPEGLLGSAAAQREELIGHLVRASRTSNANLQHCAGSLLHSILQKSGLIQFTPAELYAWLQPLKDGDGPADLFTSACITLVSRAAEYEEKLAMIFGKKAAESSSSAALKSLIDAMLEEDFLEKTGQGGAAGRSAEFASPKISPLFLAYFDCCSATKEKLLDVQNYTAAVLSSLLHLQQHETATVAQAFASKAPSRILKDGLKSYLKFWTNPKTVPSILAGELNLRGPMKTLFEVFSNQVTDFSSAQQQWREEIDSSRSNREALELIVQHGTAYIAALRGVRGSGEVQQALLGLLEQLFQTGDDSNVSRHVLGVLLQNWNALEWFSPLGTTDEFLKRFTQLLVVLLPRAEAKLRGPFQQKLLSCALDALSNSGIKSERKKKANIEFEELIPVFQLFDFTLPELQQLIEAIAEKPGTSWTKLLNLLLRKVAQLRLGNETYRQRIDSSVLRKVVQLPDLGSVQQGLYEVLSLCPELLQPLEEELKLLLNKFLDADEDASLLCGLLLQESQDLKLGFYAWCKDPANQDRFLTVNWRVKLLLLLLGDGSIAAEDEFRSLMDKIKDPFLELYQNSEEFTRALQDFPEVDRLCDFIVDRICSAEDSKQLCEKLTNFKKISCKSFRNLARRSQDNLLHLKLILRSACGLLKNADSSIDPELKDLVEEAVWLLEHAKMDPGLGTLLEDSSWTKFMKYSLKVGLRIDDPTTAKLSLKLLTAVWETLGRSGSSDSLSVTAQQMHEMISTHSDFISLILDEENSHSEQKELVLRLVLTVLNSAPKICQHGHIPLLLASYGASLSAADQLVLRILVFYEQHGVLLSQFRPYMWGPAAAAHFSLRKGIASRLNTQPEAAEVLGLLDSEKLLRTAFSFPQTIALSSTEQQESNAEVYDPRFLLPLLSHLLAPEYVAQCGRFTQSGGVPFLLAALSSYHGDVRTAAWHAIGRFSDQLQAADAWPERILWLHMIECLRRGAAAQLFRQKDPKYPPKLPNIVTLFMAKAAAILPDPMHPLYRPINNYLSVKPTLDAKEVPEFLVLLHSTDLPVQSAQQRTFLLQILRDGIKSPLDYLICAKRRVFRLLLSLFSSHLLADSQTRNLILEVIQSAFKIPALAYDLVLSRGILSWLEGVVLGGHQVSPRKILSAVGTLWRTLYSHLLRKRQEKKLESEEEAQLQQEMNKIEREEEDEERAAPTAAVAKSQPPVEKPQSSTNSKNSKPTWATLPPQQQILPPWVVLELQQLLLNIWKLLRDDDLDLALCREFIELLTEVFQHAHEAQQLVRAAEAANPNSVKLVFPANMLDRHLLQELVSSCEPFISSSPDLKEHLDRMESQQRVGSSPQIAMGRWVMLYNRMRSLNEQQEEQEENSLRSKLHLLISFAEFGM